MRCKIIFSALMLCLGILDGLWRRSTKEVLSTSRSGNTAPGAEAGCLSRYSARSGP